MQCCPKRLRRLILPQSENVEMKGLKQWWGTVHSVAARGPITFRDQNRPLSLSTVSSSPFQLSLILPMYSFARIEKYRIKSDLASV